MGPHFSRFRQVSRVGRSWHSDHPYTMSCLHCDLPEILELIRPPDPDIVDLIEQALLEGQIDRLKADLAYLWLPGNSRISAA